MGALSFIWKSQEIDLRTKCFLYKVIPLNLLLWGTENWAQNAADIALLGRFHHRPIRRILGINMLQVKDENCELREKIGGMPPISLIIAKNN